MPTRAMSRTSLVASVVVSSMRVSSMNKVHQAGKLQQHAAAVCWTGHPIVQRYEHNMQYACWSGYRQMPEPLFVMQKKTQTQKEGKHVALMRSTNEMYCKTKDMSVSQLVPCKDALSMSHLRVVDCSTLLRQLCAEILISLFSWQIFHQQLCRQQLVKA